MFRWYGNVYIYDSQLHYSQTRQKTKMSFSRGKEVNGQVSKDALALFALENFLRVFYALLFIGLWIPCTILYKHISTNVSRGCDRFHVFPRLPPCAPLATCFSRACHSLHVFPALAIGYMFFFPALATVYLFFPSLALSHMLSHQGFDIAFFWQVFLTFFSDRVSCANPSFWLLVEVIKILWNFYCKKELRLLRKTR